MSFVLLEHEQRVSASIARYRTEIAEIEGHIRLRAMSNDASEMEIRFLRRLATEKSEILSRYQNLGEAVKFIMSGAHASAE